MIVKCLPNLLNENVSTTGFTHQWVLEILQKYVPEFKKIVNRNTVTLITANDISGGQGYCSRVYKTCIFVDDQKEPVYNFIMKIPTADIIKALSEDMFDADSNEMENLKILEEQWAEFHNIECNFYETFNNKTKLPLPKVYFTKKHLPSENQIGVIFMEDMSNKLSVLGIYPSLNVFQIKTIVNHLAEFHAELLTNEKPWKNKFKPYYDPTFIDVMKNSILKLSESYPGMFETLAKKLEPIIDIKFIDYQLKGCTEDLDLPMVISFGDLWTNNIFWERKEDNIPNKILAFVDFQIAFEGSIATDVCRIITMGCDAEDRRSIEQWICEYYFDQLTKHMGRKPDFTVENFKTAYDYAKLHHTNWLMMFCVMFKKDQDLDEGEKAILDAKLQKLALRTKFAMEDCVKILERLRPDLMIGA